MNFNRVSAIVLRHVFLATHQLERLADLIIFPVFGLLLWGFLAKSEFVQSANLGSVLVGGLILWIVFERVGTGIGIDFMWDIWEHNLMNVLASPITLFEHIGGLIATSLIKVAVSIFLMWILSALFYGFNPASLGSSLVFLWANVILFSVSMGIFNVAVIMRWGHAMGPLTWILPFAVQPFSAAFYPVSVLPVLVQKIVWFLPLTHVFEGMRYTLRTGKMDINNLMIAFVLNLAYFVVVIAFFTYMFARVRKIGTLAKL